MTIEDKLPRNLENLSSSTDYGLKDLNQRQWWEKALIMSVQGNLGNSHRWEVQELHAALGGNRLLAQALTPHFLWDHSLCFSLQISCYRWTLPSCSPAYPASVISMYIPPNPNLNNP